jgi:hypothetical protein
MALRVRTEVISHYPIDTHIDPMRTVERHDGLFSVATEAVWEHV